MSIYLEEDNKWSRILQPIEESLGDEEYHKLLNALSSEDINGIVDVLFSVCIAKNEIKKRFEMERTQMYALMADLQMPNKSKDIYYVIKCMKQNIDDICIECRKKNTENAVLKKRLEESRQREQDLSIQVMGMTPEAGRKMKEEYEQGKSLRQLAKDYGCDKATVKRRLIRMGADIRE